MMDYEIRTFVPPHFGRPVALGAHGRASKGTAMKRLLVAAVIAGSFFSFEANAQERAGSAALGAVSGAVVLGPVGAVAGALIGFTAGPAIAHSWGIGHSNSRSRARVAAAQASAGTPEAAGQPRCRLPSLPMRVLRKTAPPVAKSARNRGDQNRAACADT